MGLRKTRNEESWTDCGENKTSLKIYKIIFSIAKDRNQWIAYRTPEETSERSGDCWWGGGGSQGGKGAKRMFRDLDGFIRKNQAQNGLKMSFFFFFGLFFHVFPWFCPLHVFLPLDYFFFFFSTTLCSMWDLSFLTRSWTSGPYSGSTVLTLDHQGSPMDHFVLNNFSSFFVFSALLFSLLLPLFFIPSFFYTPRPNQNEAL